MIINTVIRYFGKAAYWFINSEIIGIIVCGYIGYLKYNELDGNLTIEIRREICQLGIAMGSIALTVLIGITVLFSTKVREIPISVELVDKVNKWRYHVGLCLMFSLMLYPFTELPVSSSTNDLVEMPYIFLFVLIVHILFQMVFLVRNMVAYVKTQLENVNN